LARLTPSLADFSTFPKEKGSKQNEFPLGVLCELALQKGFFSARVNETTSRVLSPREAKMLARKWLIAVSLCLGLSTTSVLATETVSGAYPQAFTTLTPAAPPANALSNVHKQALSIAMSCVDATNCTALFVYQQGNGSDNLQPFALTETAGIWGQPQLLFGSDGVTNAIERPSVSGISCWAAGECIAVGSVNVGYTSVRTALVLSEHHSSWDTGQALPLASGVTAQRLTSVSCPTATTCAAAGSAESVAPIRSLPLVVDEVDGTWSTPALITLPDDATTQNPRSELSSISCTSSTCTAVGSYFTASSTTRPLIARGRGASTQLLADLTLPNGATNGGLSGISCLPVSGCVAVGFAAQSTTYTGMLVTEVAGQWTASTTSLGDTSTSFQAVSCLTSNVCEFSGQSQSAGVTTGLVGTEDGGVVDFAAVSPPSGTTGGVVNAISCATSCTGLLTVNRLGGSPYAPMAASISGTTIGTAITLAVPSDIGISGDGNLLAVHCPSVSHCVGLGVYRAADLSFDLYAQTFTGHDAGTAVQVATSVSAVPGGVQLVCSDQANCVGVFAGDRLTTVLNEVAGVWTSSHPFPNGDELVSLACETQTSCTAVGTDQVHHLGITATLQASTWSVPTAITTSGLSNVPFTSLTSVSCWAVGECVAVGMVGPDQYLWDQAAMTLTETGGVWGSATIPTPWPHSNFFSSYPASISCPSAARCVVVGTFFGSEATSQYTNGSWSSPLAAVLPSGAGSELFTGVDCPDVLNCVASGSMVNSLGTEQAFIAKGSITSTANGSHFIVSPLTSPYVGANDPLTVTASVGAVSCASTTDCALVGSYSTPEPNAIQAPVFVMTGTPPPGAPLHLSAVPHDQSVTMSWDLPAANGSLPATSFTAVIGAHSCTSTAQSCTVTGLTNGTHYNATVYAQNGVGQGPAATPIDVFAASVPAPPSLTFTLVAGGVQLTSTPPLSNGGAPITGYTYTYTYGGKVFGAGTVRNASDALTIVAPANGAKITVQATANNIVGSSVPSQGVVVQFPLLPTPPTNVVALSGPTSIAVSWTASTSLGNPVTGYTVSAVDSLSVAHTCSTTITSCTITGLSQKSYFTIIVTAKNADGSTDAPSVWIATAPHQVGPPGPVTALTGTPASSSVQLKWKTPAKQGFGPDIFVVTKTVGATTVQVGLVVGNTLKVGGLASKTSYTFTVRTLAANGQLSVPTTLTIKTK